MFVKMLRGFLSKISNLDKMRWEHTVEEKTVQYNKEVAVFMRALANKIEKKPSIGKVTHTWNRPVKFCDSGMLRNRAVYAGPEVHTFIIKIPKPIGMPVPRSNRRSTEEV